MPHTIARFGWIPDLPDARDFIYKPSAAILRRLPSRVDLRPQCPRKVYQQGRLGSCTANAIAGAIEFDQIKQGDTEFTPSRLFIYYNERAINHHELIDSGAEAREGIKVVVRLGACPESEWPYSSRRPRRDGQPCPDCKFAQMPPPRCYRIARKNLVTSYLRLKQDLKAMKACLASGYPFVFGFTIYSNMPRRTKTGFIPMPTARDTVLAGHVVLAVGYDDARRVIIVRNSWGHGWGRGGYGFFPYEYIRNPNLAEDFWTIRSVKDSK